MWEGGGGAGLRIRSRLEGGESLIGGQWMGSLALLIVDSIGVWGVEG